MRAPFSRLQVALQQALAGSINVTRLIIKVEQIEEPRQLEERPLTRDFLEGVFADAPAYSVRAPAELQAHVTRVGERDVLLEGATTVQLRSHCRRCLEDVDSELPVVFTVNLVARKEEPAAAGKSRHREIPEENAEAASSSPETDPDEEVFDGETIDLAPIVREQLLLGLPATEPLCKETCKGLCPTCGQDLNEKDCGHSQKQLDPRWAALKDLKV
jgi:uncharacterized protein